MTTNDNGERRLLWKALNVLSVILLTAVLALTGWMLTQVVQLKINVACLTDAQERVVERLGRLEHRIDAAGKVTRSGNEH